MKIFGKQIKINGKKFALMFVFSLLALSMLSEAVLAIINSIVVKGQQIAYIIPLYVMPIVAFLVTGALYFFLSTHKNYSDTLIESMNKVAQGDYTVRIGGEKVDREWGKIYDNFNKMVMELSSVHTMREDFVRNFSHEFKTPISSIHGFAQLILDGGLTDEERESFLKIIVDETGRLWRMADNMLIFSKLENQQILGDIKELDVAEQIRESIIMLQTEWEKKKIEISSDLEDVTMHASTTYLKQVWINLINNAIKYTPEGGKIEVKLVSEGDNIVVTVSDNGIGIASEDMDKIFERYYRTGKSKAEGNGLGLAICKRICDLSGGEITATSTLGKGSTFFVTLPKNRT
jgi:signal transduction histidine kinase